MFLDNFVSSPSERGVIENIFCASFAKFRFKKKRGDLP